MRRRGQLIKGESGCTDRQPETEGSERGRDREVGGPERVRRRGQLIKGESGCRQEGWGYDVALIYCSLINQHLCSR